MAVTYRASLKATRMQAVLDDIDNHASPAKLRIFTAAFALQLAEIVLADPAFTRSAAVLTMAGVPKSDTSADNTGTAAVARIVDGGNVTIIDDLTVGVGSGDIQLNSLSITAGQTVTINSGTITHG